MIRMSETEKEETILWLYIQTGKSSCSVNIRVKLRISNQQAHRPTHFSFLFFSLSLTKELHSGYQFFASPLPRIPMVRIERASIIIFEWNVPFITTFTRWRRFRNFLFFSWEHEKITCWFLINKYRNCEMFVDK